MLIRVVLLIKTLVHYKVLVNEEIENKNNSDRSLTKVKDAINSLVSMLDYINYARRLFNDVDNFNHFSY